MFEIGPLFMAVGWGALVFIGLGFALRSLGMTRATLLRISAFAGLLLIAWCAHGQVAAQSSLKGRITSAGYEPPANAIVTWVCTDGIVHKRLNPDIHWRSPGDVFGFYGRYGEADQARLQGPCRIGAVGSEQLGKDCWWILRVLLGRDPCPIGPNGEQDGRCEDVYDLCAVEVGGTSPATCCDFQRITGQLHPVTGVRCQCGGGGGGGSVEPRDKKVPAPTDVRLDGRRLSFSWTGRKGDVATWGVYASSEGGPASLLGETRVTGTGSLQALTLEIRESQPGSRVVLRGTIRRMEAVEVEVAEAGPPPPPPPPAQTCAEKVFAAAAALIAEICGSGN